MKTKGRKILYAFIAVIFIVIAVSSLYACDDDTDTLVYEPLTFEEGTTLEEVLEMFEDGRIENCTVEANYYINGEHDLYGVLKANKSIFYRYSDSYTEKITEEEYMIYSDEDAKVYYIDDFVQIGAECFTDYEWYEHALYDDAMGWMLESLYQIFNDDELSIIVIEGSEIKVSDERGETKYRIYDMNATQIAVSQKYADYKQLAVKKD